MPFLWASVDDEWESTEAEKKGRTEGAVVGGGVLGLGHGQGLEGRGRGNSQTQARAYPASSVRQRRRISVGGFEVLGLIDA